MQQFNLEFKGIKLGTATVNAPSLDEAKTLLVKELNKQFTYIQFMEISDASFKDKEDIENVVDTM